MKGDFFVVKDDTNSGIKKMTNENSHDSARIMQRQEVIITNTETLF